MDGASRSRRRRRRAVASDDAARQTRRRIPHLRRHGRPGPRIVIAIDGLAAGLRREIDPFPGAVCDESRAGKLGCERTGFVVVGRRVFLIDLGAVLAVEPVDRLLQVLRRRLFACQHRAGVHLLRVPSRKQRHVRLLACGENRRRRFGKEISIDHRAEPGRALFSRGFEDLRGRHRAHGFDARRAEIGRELDAVRLACRQRHGRQRAQDRPALADRARDQILRQRRRHLRAHRNRSRRFTGDRHLARVAAERRDILLHPLQRGMLIEQAHSRRKRDAAMPW